MYTLVRLVSWGRLLREQVPALLLSFIIAELSYKFHSFTLETLAFLATWSLIDALIQVARYAIVGITSGRHDARLLRIATVWLGSDRRV